MEKWLIRSTNSDLAKFGKTDREKIIYRIISNRGINTEEELKNFLEPDISKMHSQSMMNDMDIAANILLEAFEEQKKIRIVGDYDVDGIMSTYILYTFIKNEDKNTDYYLPNRIKDGYGLSVEIVEKAISDKVDVIITCDNGITAFDAISKAEDAGIDVIVLDHHEPKLSEDEKEQEYPRADAVVNPKRSDSTYPFSGLCGASVSYKFVEYVSAILGYEDGEIIRDYLEFAAFATVCDVMELIDENRIIVYNGLKLLNNTTNLGFKTLIDEAGISGKRIEPYHIGFILGPMFNASGRLDTAEKGLNLLLERDISKARMLARELKNLNEERTKLTMDGVNRIYENIDVNKLYEDDIIVAYDDTIHESIAGIIAGRVKEKFNKPAIILTNSGGLAKGSGRSIEEYDITKGISKEKELLKSFGGHKLAAGVSMPIENIDAFRKRINDNSNLTEEDLYRKVYIDLGLPISFVDEDFIEELEKLSPFGTGNPRPLFGARDVVLMNISLIGKKSNVIKLEVKEKSKQLDAIIFQKFEEFKEQVEKTGCSLAEIIARKDRLVSDIVYQPKINEWNARRSIQLNITNFRIKRRG